MNLYAILKSGFGRQPSSVALTENGGPSFTYAGMDAQSARIARLLAARGLRTGDRVAAQLAKSASQIILYHACLRSGLVFAPLNPAAPARETQRLLDDLEPALLVTDDTGDPARSERWQSGALPLDALIEASATFPPEQTPAEVAPESLASIIYTSGSSGAPKGAMLPHALVSANAVALHRQWDIRSDDVMLHAMPLFNTHGLSFALNGVLLAGGRVRLLPRFEAAAVVANMPDATMFSGVPTMYARLLADSGLDRRACRNMRLFISSSASLPASLHRRFEAATSRRILQCYGLTETGTLTSARPRDEGEGDSVGRALPGVDLRVVDQAGKACPPGVAGELQARKPTFFSGYWRSDAAKGALTSDGYFRTGDIAEIDGDGRVTIVGRASDLIVSGGFNIYPAEVEQALMRVDGVEDCAVVGVRDDDLGEKVAAAVVGTRLTTEALAAALGGELSSSKRPRLIQFVPTIPRNAGGKTDVARLRALFESAPTRLRS